MLLGLVGEHDCDGAQALERLEISLARRARAHRRTGRVRARAPTATPSPSRSPRRPRGSSSCRRARRCGSATARSAPSTSCWAWCGSATASPARCWWSSAPICPGPVRPSSRWCTSSARPASACARARRPTSTTSTRPRRKLRPGPRTELIDWDDPAALGAAADALRRTAPAVATRPPPARPARLLARRAPTDDPATLEHGRGRCRRRRSCPCSRRARACARSCGPTWSRCGSGVRSWWRWPSPRSAAAGRARCWGASGASSTRCSRRRSTCSSSSSSVGGRGRRRASSRSCWAGCSCSASPVPPSTTADGRCAIRGS